jgi:hypothetical protein
VRVEGRGAAGAARQWRGEWRRGRRTVVLGAVEAPEAGVGRQLPRLELLLKVGEKLVDLGDGEVVDGELAGDQHACSRGGGKKGERNMSRDVREGVGRAA